MSPDVDDYIYPRTKKYNTANRGGSLITAVFYCSNNDILNKYLRYGCVHMQMAVYAGHYSGHYSENYSKQF